MIIALRLLWLSAVTLGVFGQDPIVKTKSGSVKGFTDTLYNVDVFWGIPFATPPLGDLRFKAPQPHKPWTTTFDATNEPPVCVQAKAIIGDHYKGQEDCLTLDIYTPTGQETKKEKLPVMVWIHGGGNTMGTSHGSLALPGLSRLYDGKRFVNENGVIIASINYRLGTFGWLALEALRHEDPHGSTGNWGLMDQRLGMQWVKDNIEAFGGDVNRITVFGESAGGTAVCAHWVSPASKGLFHRLIGESALCTGTLPFIPLNVAENFGKLWVEHIGCWHDNSSSTTLDCIRKLPPGKLLQPLLIFPQELPPNKANIPLPTGMPLFPLWEVVDGTDVGIPDHPEKMIQKGNFNNVPIILGTNHNEGSIFTIIVALAINETLPFNEHKVQKLLEYLTQHNQTLVKEVSNLYPPAHYSSETNRVSHMLTHFLLACPERVMIRNANQYNQKHNIKGKDTYMYMFNRSAIDIDPALGDFHSIELPYVFNNEIPYIYWTDADRKLSRQMGHYWSTFARTGNPNTKDPKYPCDGCIPWPLYTATDPHHAAGGNKDITFQKRLVSQVGLYEKYCDFWDKIGYDLLPSPT